MLNIDAMQAQQQRVEEKLCGPVQVVEWTVRTPQRLRSRDASVAFRVRALNVLLSCDVGQDRIAHFGVARLTGDPAQPEKSQSDLRLASQAAPGYAGLPMFVVAPLETVALVNLNQRLDSTHHRAYVLVVVLHLANTQQSFERIADRMK